ncbi:LysR family transcriptional regulator [Pseudomonas asuensis]|jgi:DNA-binding transcriptional LysR family regulator|uniref:LysR family transcriptional regulator n=1 Tax=Pseudomonas asuensis TaxID=1825787 RepID=A0ABQ2GX19_9PSED|nr:LysR family transcriptional regulator [Pseudomonas asuensis]GGM16296.1 LysR family transcriptional regulator [Pseudomonas asuensis]
MDKLLALRMFVETVRCGGYSAAARKLQIATSSVTRQVAALEAELGSALLNRSTRHNFPTEAGQLYFDSAVAILEALERADNAVTDRGTCARGKLRVSVPVEFGRRVIAPHLPRLLAQHPDLEISLHLSDARVDLLKDRIDLSVRLGSSVSTEEIICKPVGWFERWIVASPHYLVRKPTPTLPHDISEHCCLLFDYGGSGYTWLFRQGEEQVSVNAHGRMQSNNADVLRRAVLAGEGLALLADWLVIKDVHQGRMTRLYSGYDVHPGSANGSINALYLPNHRGSTRIRVFIDFLEEILSRESTS